MSLRPVIISIAVFFGFAVVVYRLADIMLINHSRFAAEARQQHISLKDTAAERGIIYDRKGRELAVNVESQSLFCNPPKIQSPERTARLVSSVAGLDYKTVLSAMKSEKGFAWVARKLPSETAAKVRALGIEGLGFTSEAKRYYPKEALLSHLLGFVGVDNQALEAIELRYDETLKEKGVTVSLVRDAKRQALSDGSYREPMGNSLVLTVDEALQYIAEEEMDFAIERWHAQSGVAVMMNPYNGEILAMASRPAYDPNNPGRSDASARRNRAINDLYEPGSTFKLVTAAAAIEEGVAAPDTKFDCRQGFIKVDKYTIKDVHKNGILTLEEVLAKSSNVGTVLMGLELGPKKLQEYAKRFGFGAKTGIDLPGEAGGWIPKSGGDSSVASLSIGYGIAATPLQVLRAYSAIANGGVLVNPHVVAEIRTPDGYLLSSFKEDEGTRAVSKKTADMLRDMFVSVTTVNGTAPMAGIDGNAVAGKTGTTRLIDPATGKYSEERYVSSFVGFVPADNPRIALIVTLQEPSGEHYGGMVAAPVFKSITEKTLAYLNIPKEHREKENLLIVRASDI